MGQDQCSLYNNAIRHCSALLNQPGHIDKVIERQSEEQKKKNKLRVKISINAIRWLVF